MMDRRLRLAIGLGIPTDFCKHVMAKRGQRPRITTRLGSPRGLPRELWPGKLGVRGDHAWWNDRLGLLLGLHFHPTFLVELVTGKLAVADEWSSLNDWIDCSPSWEFLEAFTRELWPGKLAEGMHRTVWNNQPELLLDKWFHLTFVPWN
jgi:hypothetical protein